MKRCFVIFPVGRASYPEWFYQPMRVSDSGGTEATHLAALMVGEVPVHSGIYVEVYPSDTVRSALARAGFQRVLAETSGTASPSSVKTLVRVTVAPDKALTIWGRMKKLFGRG